MEIEIFEHHQSKCYPFLIDGEECTFEQGLHAKYSAIEPRPFPSKGEQRLCYKINSSTDDVHLQADYYVGTDWLIEGEHFVQVKPKLNTQIIKMFEEKINHEEIEEEPYINKTVVKESSTAELDYLKLLIGALSHPALVKETKDLIIIDWNMQPIPIKQEDDTLTPFLVVQFLNMLKHIVKKGLKKSYYRVQENLNNKIKGKILVSTHIKQNILKNRFTKAYCEYQEFGINHQENQFLKKVLKFASNYVATNPNVFSGNETSINQLINYCLPAFEMVTDDVDIDALKQIKFNPFFKEYKEAIKIGQYILKRFSYNISNTANQKIKTPPFWIDMPKLFELYVYHQLLSIFQLNEIKFQFATYGNKLDFLITKEGNQMVVDAKYKMHYQSRHIHEDIRQVSGYARLKKVYNELGKPYANELIDCLIIYPNNVQLDENYMLDLSAKDEIPAYKQVYKIGLPMPYI